MEQKREITRESLVRDLRALGLRAGDTVYVHSSMKKIGWMAEGPETLLHALLEVLGEEGTLAVPNHTLSFPGWGREPYDRAETPTLLGLFPETVRRDPRALRSGHGSHATAAIGAKAAYLTENHDPCHALGYDSPLHRLYRMGGRILLLGVTHTSNTSIHLAESLSGVGYTVLPYDASWGAEVACREEGEVHLYRQVEFPGCSGGFQVLDAELTAKGIQKIGQVGFAESRLVETQGLIDTAVARMHEDPGYLLCRRDDCPSCPGRWDMLRERGYDPAEKA